MKILKNQEIVIMICKKNIYLIIKNIKPLGLFIYNNKWMFGKIVDYIMKLLIVLTIGLWILAIVKPELVISFIDYIESLVLTLGNFNYIVIFLSSLIEWLPVLGVVVPGQNILLIVGWFFARIDMSNLVYVILIASLWAILSNYLWYLLWKYHWDKFFKKYGLWFGIWETEVKYLKKWIKKWWPWWIIIWKFHNVARAFVPFIAWSMWMHHRTFFIYNIIGSTLRAITIVILWVVFAQYYEVMIDYLAYIMIWLMLIAWIYIYKYKRKEFKKYIQEKNEELERKL